MSSRSVAGVYTPAFVERTASRSSPLTTRASVAGVYTPAFVERCTFRMAAPRVGSTCVAGVYTPAFVERGWTCSRRLDTCGSVAGAYAPAFVERGASSATTSPLRTCRRSLCSGLR